MLIFLPLLARADVRHVSVYATSGPSATSWHGQARIYAVNIELGRPLSRRTDAALVFSALDVDQPKSWFGDQFGDGNEHVRGGSASLLVRRRFNVDSARAQFFLEGASGPMWTERPVPASTSRFNFASHAGIGVVLLPSHRLPVILGYRFMHVSNGGYSPRNPGINFSSLMLGVRVRR